MSNGYPRDLLFIASFMIGIPVLGVAAGLVATARSRIEALTILILIVFMLAAGLMAWKKHCQSRQSK